MKKYSILIIIFLFLSNTSFAQTLDEIINKHIEAHGGKANWEKIDALKIKGMFTAFSVQKKFETIKTKNSEFYSSFSLGKNDVIQAYDGEEYWTIDPWQEIDYARKMNRYEENVIHQKAEFFTPFYNYKEKGIELEYLGKVNVEGTETFKIKLKRPGGHEEIWYLNSETYLEYKCESMWVDFAYRSPAQTFFDDFREVEGLIIPFYIERTFGQRSRITMVSKVIVNPDIDKSIFKMPMVKGLEKLAFLEGEWNVDVSLYSRRAQRMVTVDKVQSNIKFEYPHMLQQKLKFEYFFPYEFLINYAYTPDNDAYKITVYNNFEISMEIMQGQFSGDTIAFDNTKTNLSDAENDSYVKFKYIKINNDKFELEMMESAANKEEWNLRYKLVYTRVEE